ncbi:MAG: asparagine synthase (glutamine-hydrolyzing) [Spirochaetaceae bacterium]|nr:asparagine synthase (glutamine-hydrolyzing) [Spirochaetaceae bacterium]
MCGVAGIFNQASDRDVEEARLWSMLNSMRHRGPDGDGTWLHAKGLGLGHVRLAVIDLSTASNQPFVSEDGNYVLTYNGEIFNYLELRHELERMGYRFRTASDTEVLLTAYRQWGQRVCERLNGMWAFAIYNCREDYLFCSRDRFGIKPFYYAFADGAFIFASEVKALTAVAPQLATLDAGATSKFLRASIVGSVHEHYCSGVFRLPSAHNMVVTRSGHHLRRYWDYPATIDRDITFEGACDRFRELLVDSIRLRMRSDVPVGTTLSGGVDSSAIVSLLRSFFGGEHHAFTAQFDEIVYDECAVAAELANQLDVRHHRVRAEPRDFIDTLTDIVHHLDGPTPSPAVFPLWNIMREMRRHVVVALEGQGADELLGGYYSRYAPAAILDSLSVGNWREAVAHLHALLLPNRTAFQSPVRGALELGRAMVPGAHRWFRRVRGDEAVYVGVLAGGPDKQGDRQGAPSHDELLAAELRRSHEGSLATLLQYGDGISMAHSIESRLPFLDYRLVEFAFSLPGCFKMRDGKGKVLLRESIRGHVPHSVVRERPKLGFVVPIREWFRATPEKTVYPVLLSDRCRERGWFDAKAMELALRRHVSGQVDLSSQIFRWMSLELWCVRALDGA